MKRFGFIVANHGKQRESAAVSGSRNGRFGSKVGQIGPKWDKSGAFSDHILVNLALGRTSSPRNLIYRTICYILNYRNIIKSSLYNVRTFVKSMISCVDLEGVIY